MTAYSFMKLFKLTLRLDYANYEESILEHVWYMRMKKIWMGIKKRNKLPIISKI